MACRTARIDGGPGGCSLRGSCRGSTCESDIPSGHLESSVLVFFCSWIDSPRGGRAFFSHQRGDSPIGNCTKDGEFLSLISPSVKGINSLGSEFHHASYRS